MRHPRPRRNVELIPFAQKGAHPRTRVFPRWKRPLRRREITKDPRETVASLARSPPRARRITRKSALRNLT